MATPLTHGLVGAWIAQFAPSSIPRWKLAVGLGALAVLPDVDIAAFYLGISYSDMLGHRGLSHSVPFALFITAVTATCLVWKYRPGFFQAVSVFGLASIAVLSHGFLDIATNGGLGVGLFLPFSDQRYFLPFRPIEVSPINPVTFLSDAARVFSSEAKWVWFPLLVVSGVFQSGRLAASFVLSNFPTVNKASVEAVLNIECP